MGYFRENIEAAQGYTPGFQPDSTDVVKLNTNENPYPPSPKVSAALAAINPEQLRRYPDPVGSSFKAAAANVNGVAPENIMCCNGGDDLLTIAIRAFCNDGRPVAYPVPTYSLYPVLARIQNCDTIEIDFDEEFTLPSKLSRTGAALTIVCNPNAPSGSIVRSQELAALADELDGVLLIDEAYVDFAENTCIELVKQFDNVLILRSMSKGYSLAGIRFGYAIGNSALINGLLKVKDSYNVDAMSIAAATAAISDTDYFAGVIKKVKDQRSRLRDSLIELGLAVPESSTNFLLAQSKNYNAADIYDKLVKKNIYVRYFDLTGLRDKLRITVGTAEQNEQLIKALKEILKR
jgi:histidinol-phosphate aminotransferase